MLALEVEYLLGVCFAARDPSDSAPEWPVEIDRVFSAFVATWAGNGQQDEGRGALEWLESQPAPAVFASPAESRSPAMAYVPPNDPRSPDIRVLPARRSRQPRRFPASVPSRALTGYVWSEAVPDDKTFLTLRRIAADTAYVGHSSSLVRCHFRRDATGLPFEVAPRSSARCVYPGRLSELVSTFEAGGRPQPGMTVAPIVPEQPVAPASVFGERWMVFADAGGNCPDLRATAIVAQTLRKAVMSGFGEHPVPEVISGHTSDGSPSKMPHMAVLPLADVGWQWSEGRLLGVALCLPRTATDADETTLFRAIANVMRNRGSLEEDEISLDLPGGARWRLGRSAAPSAASLKPYRYQLAATCWATATPIALDRHAKSAEPSRRQDEVAEMIAVACERVALPRPYRVVPDKHSAMEGAPSAIPSPRSPPWCRWTLPQALTGRMLTHAVIEFSEPVRGPVVLGAGRFLGLGLCLPMN